MLRLRGGGGQEIHFVNLKANEKTHGMWGEHSNRGYGIYDQISKHTNISKELLIVRLSVKKSYEILGNTDTTYSVTKDFTFYYNKKTDYKEISFTQEANGIWKDTLLNLCAKTCRTVS